MAKKNDIAKAEAAAIQSVEQIESLILTIRGKQVILDRDLARLYGVETRVLNQAVQRNIERFPKDFMFQLSKEEAESSRSQFVMLNAEDELSMSQIATLNGRGHNIKHLPYAFTENGSQAQVFQRLEVVERNQLALTTQVAENNKKLEEVFRRLDDRSEKPEKGIFYDGQIFDAYTFVNDRIREAKKRIVLIDNYVDDSVLTMLDKRNKGVDAVIYTKNISRQLSLDFEKHNAQYSPIEVKQFDRAHDRFLCIDDTVYLIGASLKDLGKKWFGFVKLEQPTDELLSKM